MTAVSAACLPAARQKQAVKQREMQIIGCRRRRAVAHAGAFYDVE